MGALATVFLTNAATATILALIVAGIGLRLRRPATLHVLWVLVLLDLMTPPIVEIALLPTAEVPNAVLASGTDTAVIAPGRPIGSWLQLVWIAGIATAGALAFARSRRFARAARWARPAPPELVSTLSALARQAGLRRAPPLQVVDLRVPPMLRWRRRGFEILFPRELLTRLTPAQRDALLLHELAHVRRNDPWVRLLELAVAILFWWHPLVFWARRSLRHAEEICCDAWVLEWRPGQGRDYAEGLLKTLEFLAGTGRRIPALASGAGDFRGLEERMLRITKENRTAGLSRPVRWGLLVAALAGLLAFPIAAPANDGERIESQAATAELDRLAALELLARARAERRLDAQQLELEALAAADRRESGAAADELERSQRELAAPSRSVARHAARQYREAAARYQEDLELAREQRGVDAEPESSFTELQEVVAVIRGLTQQRDEIDRELRRALEQLERSVEELD